MSHTNGNEAVKIEREEISNSIVFQDDGDFKEEMLTELQFVVDCGEMGSAQDWPASSEFTQMKREVCLEAEQQFATEYVSYEDKETAPGKRSLLERIESLISENDRIIQTVEQTDEDAPPSKRINVSEYDNSALERIETIISENDRIVQSSDPTFEETFPIKRSEFEQNEEKNENETNENLNFKILEDSGQITLKCDVCSAFFTTCQELELHLQTHTQVTQCQICFNLFMTVTETEICNKCQENSTTETVFVDGKEQKQEIIYETVIINDVTGNIKTENGEIRVATSEIIIPDISFQCLGNTGILNDTEILNTNFIEERESYNENDIITKSDNTFNDVKDSNSEESNQIPSEYESIDINTNIQYSDSLSESTVNSEPIPCSSKEDVLERIDRIINKNTRIMHESKIPKTFPKQVPTVKKEQILNRIEKIIEKNTSVLDSSKVQLKPTSTQVNCTECGLNFISEEFYQEHIRTAHTFTFPCLICCSQFSSVTIFNEHLKHIHKICKACNESFKTHQEFNHHENCHKFGLIKFYQCQICYNDFKKLDGLMEHMDSIHSMQQPYPVKTVKKYLLNNISSPALDLLQCVYCDVKFTKNEQLEDHLNLQHGVENTTKIV